MAPPQSEAVITSLPRAAKKFERPPRLSNDHLKRTISDIAFELSKEIINEDITDHHPKALPSISEAKDAKCECCGMCEEYTPEYIKNVRDMFSGRWICGLCSEAVKGEMEKNGEKKNIEEALDTHMSHCVRFNKLGRAYPVLCQAQAMREILKKGSRGRAKSMSPRDINGPKGGLARSSSCISAITKEINDLTMGN